MGAGYTTFVVDEQKLERELRRVGTRLAAAMPPPTHHPVRAVNDRAMDLVAHDPQLRAALFRFVDVAPACRSLDDLALHLSALLAEVDAPSPPAALAVRMAASRAGRAALGATAAAGVRHMAHRFIVGETPEAALPVLAALWQRGVAASVDLLGEATVTAAEADSYADRCAAALEALSRAAADWAPSSRLERDGMGPLPRVNLSVKVSALTPLLRPEAPGRGQDDASQRLRPLLRTARECGGHLHVDMESLDTRDAVLGLVLAVLSEKEFRCGPSAGVVVQAYLRDSGVTLRHILDWARKGAGARRGTPLTVRLVKGAYWDHEIVEARQQGWPAPVYEHKSHCDANFEALTRRLIDARGRVRVAVASHNLRSVSQAVAYNRLTGGADQDLEVQVLRGLGDALQDAVASEGLRVRTYCPVGGLVSGMAYLVRRLLENTSNESFLHEQSRGAPLEQLLSPPSADGTPAGGVG